MKPRIPKLFFPTGKLPGRVSAPSGRRGGAIDVVRRLLLPELSLCPRVTLRWLEYRPWKSPERGLHRGVTCGPLARTEATLGLWTGMNQASLTPRR